MAFIGNTNGPRESQVLQSLGSQYFGCSPAGLENDISHAEFSEQRGEVVPVHVDQSGLAYLEFSSPQPGRPQRYYLAEYGFELQGDVQTFTDEERMNWLVRSLVEEK